MAREREELSLSPAQRCSAFAKHVRIATGQATNDAVGANARRRGGDVFLRQSARQPNVARDVTGEEKDVLLHVADQRTQLVERHLANVDARIAVERDGDASALRV